MNWNELIGLRISELVTQALLQDDRIQFKKSEEDVRKRIEYKIRENFQKEKELVEEVYKMMEDLENQGHSFERQKMFPMLKAQIAKKKGIVL